MDVEHFLKSRCETCIYWEGRSLFERNKETDKMERVMENFEGYCRVRPPVFRRIGGREIEPEYLHEEEKYGKWPTTSPDDWCGEWVLDETQLK